MKGNRQAGFTIPVTMLLVSVLMVLSTAIVAMTIASFRDAARTRNRAEILNVSEIGLKLAVAEIMPGLSLLPNAYWSFATDSASASISSAATPSEPSKDVTHEFQIFANVRNWSPFADWSQWDPARTYAQNLLNPDWSNGWWVVPRNQNYDDAYYNEDANALDNYPTPLPANDKSSNWLLGNPASGSSQLAFPVRMGSSSIPVRNLYWYWLTEIDPNTPTNTQLRNAGLTDPFFVNSPPVTGNNSLRNRDVGIGAWPNREEYSDRDFRLAAGDGTQVNYDNGSTRFTLNYDRYNFLNTPVLKKIYTVDHRGQKIRVAVYCRMILREYFIDSDQTPPAYPANFLKHMRRYTDGGGPNVVFYLVAVNESTATQRGVRVQQAIYVPVGPGNPQDISATLRNASIQRRFSANDGAMLPGALELIMDKKLLQGATMSGRILPASGDFSYRIPHHDPLIDPAQRGKRYINPNQDPVLDPKLKNVNGYHPHWVYLIEWNGITQPTTPTATYSGPFVSYKEPDGFGGTREVTFLSTNSALIWKDESVNPPRWRRTPFRLDTAPVSASGSARIEAAHTETPPVRLGNGATPSAYVDAWGRFEIGHSRSTDADCGAAFAPASGSQGVNPTRWLGPGVDVWGRSNHVAASFSYYVVTDLQIPNQLNTTPRYGRPASATRSVATAPQPAP